MTDVRILQVASKTTIPVPLMYSWARLFVRPTSPHTAGGSSSSGTSWLYCNESLHWLTVLQPNEVADEMRVCPAINAQTPSFRFASLIIVLEGWFEKWSGVINSCLGLPFVLVSSYFQNYCSYSLKLSQTVHGVCLSFYIYLSVYYHLTDLLAFLSHSTSVSCSKNITLYSKTTSLLFFI